MNTESTESKKPLVRITNPDVEVTLPVWDYGYRTTKMRWEDLVQIIEVEAIIPKLTRSLAQQHEYEVFRYHVKEQYASMVDYLLISKFDFEAIPAEAGKSKAHPCLQDSVDSKIILIENDFPYFVEDHIVHYVLWKLKEPITPQEIEDARAELQSEKIGAVELLQWTNPPNIKSVPEIDHVHFLCKLKVAS